MPEKDPRLQNTIENGYKMWHDGFTLKLPVGQSTTKPTMPETISVNAQIIGEIDKGDFLAPCAEFWNTEPQPKLFDKFCFAIYRNEFKDGWKNAVIIVHFIATGFYGNSHIFSRQLTITPYYNARIFNTIGNSTIYADFKVNHDGTSFIYQIYNLSERYLRHNIEDNTIEIEVTGIEVISVGF